ncbi:MAG: prolipoprotein diacylglyceryl transferase [Clostridia bacterium]|nr:prolipoprotein diacylglyceryl transferase [Clostridia bacterium]MBQ6183996.1 prolipoprotein diacylglyceryl transferase [Clostridia bacterium]
MLEGNPVSNGAMSLFGAVFFMPVAYWLGAKIFKRDMRIVFDLFTVPLVFTLACARVNCLFAGCCKGLVIPFIHSHTVRWPVREAELVFYAVLLAFFVIRTFKSKTNGELYPIYLMAYGVFRFVIEFFRESDHILGLFHISHLWAMLALIIGASVYFEIHNKKRKKRS